MRHECDNHNDPTDHWLDLRGVTREGGMRTRKAMMDKYEIVSTQQLIDLLTNSTETQGREGGHGSSGDWTGRATTHIGWISASTFSFAEHG